MTRTFIAIELGDEARNYLSQQLRRLAQALPRQRWVDPDTLHLTLSFLGELDDEQLEKVSQATRATAAEQKPFTLRIGSLGAFGPPRSPRVIWMGVTGNIPRLLDLQTQLTRLLAEQGFPPEDRPYSPHLTLARIKDPLSNQELATLQRLIPPPRDVQARPNTSSSTGENSQEVTIPVEHLSVMKSELLRGGPRYTRLHLCPLKIT